MSRRRSTAHDTLTFPALEHHVADRRLPSVFPSRDIYAAARSGREAGRVRYLERGGWTAQGWLIRRALGWADAEAIRCHRRCCMLVSARFTDLFIDIGATMSDSNCRMVTCPLAQSVERIHGKENPGAILLVR
jgi:hypothetical protein